MSTERAYAPIPIRRTHSVALRAQLRIIQHELMLTETQRSFPLSDLERQTLEEDMSAILEELYQRKHDLEDPSSGLGCHQPT